MKNWAFSRFLIAGTVGLLSVVAISQADGCPVCFSAKEGSREAFIGTTIVLSLLPLLMIGGIAFWLKKYGASSEEQGSDG